MRNAQQIYDYFHARGVTDAGCSAWLAQASAESAGNPRAVQPNGVGHGLFQWSKPGRWSTLCAYASRTNADPWSLSLQLSFAEHEARQMGLWDTVAHATSSLAATALLVRRYEMPADQSNLAIARRDAAGRAALATVRRGAPPHPVPSPSPAPAPAPTPRKDPFMIAYVVPDDPKNLPGDGVIAVSGATAPRRVTAAEWRALVADGAHTTGVSRADWTALAHP
jgi:hypothetical protein